MDFDKLFAFLSEDQDWVKKVGIAAVLILTQIGTIAVMGWAAEIARRIAEDDPDPLPEWDPIGDYFVSGLKLIGVSLVWFLPPALLVICQSSLMIFALRGSGSDSLAGVLTASSLLVYLLIFIYIIGAGLVFSPLYVLAAEGADYKDLLKPAPAWKLIKANFPGYILSILVSGLITIIMVSVGILACFIGSFFGGALGFVFMAILIGQATGVARGSLMSGSQSAFENEATRPS
jgi:hypothetical protein